MITPVKYKLSLPNIQATLKLTKITKEFDSIKIINSNFDQVSLGFYSAGKSIHFINITKNIEKIENNEKSDKMRIILDSNAISVEKKTEIIIEIDLKKGPRNLGQFVNAFFKTVKEFHTHSLDKNYKKLKLLPRIYHSSRSYKPQDTLTPNSRKREFENNLSNELTRRKLDFDLIIKKSPEVIKNNEAKQEKNQRRKSLNSNEISPRRDLIKSIEKSKRLIPKIENDLSIRNGFVNQGNTCYINSVMQVLTRIKIFEQKLMKIRKLFEKEDETVTFEIIKLIDLMKINKNPIKLERLKEKIQSKFPVFNGKNQQDCHEFLSSLFEILERELNSQMKSAESPLQFCFASDISQVIKCLKCNTKKTKIIKEYNFSIDFISNSIFYVKNALKNDKNGLKNDKNGLNSSKNGSNSSKNALNSLKNESKRPSRNCKNIIRSYDETQTYEEKCKIHGDFYMSQKVKRDSLKNIFFSCDFESCGFVSNSVNKRQTRKKKSIRKLLRRYFSSKPIDFFKCSSCDVQKAVITLRIERPPRILILHLKRFAFGGEKVVKLNDEIEIDLEIDLKDYLGEKGVGEDCSYELHSIVRHKGESSDSGHYLSDVIGEDGTWMEYNDSICRNLGERNEIRGDWGRECYLLFYRLVYND